MVDFSKVEVLSLDDFKSIKFHQAEHIQKGHLHMETGTSMAASRRLQQGLAEQMKDGGRGCGQPL